MPGFLSFSVKGKSAKIFEKEKGNHRWQRIPPSEKRGRVHTSSVTVAVLDDKQSTQVELDYSDIEFRTYKAGGKGGQHRNKTDSAVEVTHLPTGIISKCDSERSQYQNKQLALELLERKLNDQFSNAYLTQRSEERRAQVGTGLRSDKIQTVQEQNGHVVNHITGKKLSLKRYLKGDIVALHR